MPWVPEITTAFCMLCTLYRLEKSAFSFSFSFSFRLTGLLDVSPFPFLPPGDSRPSLLLLFRNCHLLRFPFFYTILFCRYYTWNTCRRERTRFLVPRLVLFTRKSLRNVSLARFVRFSRENTFVERYNGQTVNFVAFYRKAT